MNDQYSGTDPWCEFFARVDGQEPPIRALGITDYFLIDTYEQACQGKAAGSLPGVHFLFPNVEIRLSTGTVSSSAINAHPLFSPNDADHLERIRRLMGGFKFRYLRDEFRCERSELIRLGRVHDPSIVDEDAALTAGVNQFKIDFEDLRQTWETNDWFRNNCLVAVAAGERDGTSGLRDELGSFAATRTNIEGFAHIIFSGNPKQAEFYSGKGRVLVEELNAKWGGVKPCLHGSDAHAHATVGKPALDRFCWLKGALSFDTLHQACMNPEGRVLIGKEPPRGALPSNAIRSVSVSNAPWMSAVQGGRIARRPDLGRAAPPSATTVSGGCGREGRRAGIGARAATSVRVHIHTSVAEPVLRPAGTGVAERGSRAIRRGAAKPQTQLTSPTKGVTRAIPQRAQDIGHP